MNYKIFGCKVNKFFAEKWIKFLRDKGRLDKSSVLIASCVVTDRAKTKFIKEIKKQIESGKKVFLTGCGVFDRGNLMSEEKFYNIYPSLKEYRDKIILLPEDIESIKFVDSPIYTKKFIVIQNGCDNFCTFCLTIYKRGKHRNRPLKEIIEEINSFVAEGGKEIVITGVNLGAWGASSTKNYKESKLADLLEHIINYTDIQRIRISSLGPEFVNDKLLNVFQHPKIMGHFHISIQSFSDKILKLMNRNYDSRQLDYVLNALRSLDKGYPISIGADIIVGFPGETEKDFMITYEAVQKYFINKLHSFPFSPHRLGETIPASRFSDQLPNGIKKQREKQLSDLGKQLRKQFIKQNFGKEFKVLIEERKDGYWYGLTENYIRVKLERDYKRGDVVKIKLDESNVVI